MRQEECSAKDEIVDALQQGLSSDNPDVRQAWQKIVKSSGISGKKRKAQAMA
jgi:hypothetical protein